MLSQFFWVVFFAVVYVCGVLYPRRILSLKRFAEPASARRPSFRDVIGALISLVGVMGLSWSLNRLLEPFHQYLH